MYNSSRYIRPLTRHYSNRVTVSRSGPPRPVPRRPNSVQANTGRVPNTHITISARPGRVSGGGLRCCSGRTAFSRQQCKHTRGNPFRGGPFAEPHSYRSMYSGAQNIH